MLGDFSLHTGDIVTLADTVRDAAGRPFSAEPLTASLRAAQKVAFDVSAVKKSMARGQRAGPTRDAFIDLSRNMLLAERVAFSAAISQTISSAATKLSPFRNDQPIQAVVDCISDICPPHIAKNLADLRLQHLKKTEAIQSGIRASKASQKAKDTSPRTWPTYVGRPGSWRRGAGKCR